VAAERLFLARPERRHKDDILIDVKDRDAIFVLDEAYEVRLAEREVVGAFGADGAMDRRDFVDCEAQSEFGERGREPIRVWAQLGVNIAATTKGRC
jgi:hypothetical protein